MRPPDGSRLFVAKEADGMRVITGTARGRRLRALEGLDARPTTDRVKEGLFSAIQFDIEGRRVLDLFAGTGQLGIECLSRGAARAVFADSNPKAVALIRDNLRQTGLQDRAAVLQTDALEYLARTKERFDLIFLDPPYASGLLEAAVKGVAAFDILKPRGIIVAESPRTAPFPALPGTIRAGRTYRYGKIAVTLFRRADGDAVSNEERAP
ncbi:MAG: 16S rRNA (guanine(966)-N(2))-methyltransferase RsmD [Oscillibacter sp.]|nr:16S rRNA (guanine(966)-N(2))-methyltransferase RsmD [Oscillibacter sp.]